MTNKQQHAHNLIVEGIQLDRFTSEMARLQVQVVQPDQMVPAVYYMDERRFFPLVDDNQRVLGGNFG